MNKYELMTIFPIEEEKSNTGKEAVKAVLTEFGATIEKEDLFAERDLAYEIKKNKRGRFYLFTIKANPAKISDISRQFGLNHNLLKYLFVKLDKREN